MRGVYSVVGSTATLTTAKTLIQIKAGAATSLEILRAWISQTTSETSDTSEAQVLRKSATATVTSFTPLLFEVSDQAAKAVGGTSATGINASGEGTDGDILIREGFNVLAGWTWLPTPEERIFVEPAGFIGLKFNVNISSATLVYGMIFRELA